MRQSNLHELGCKHSYHFTLDRAEEFLCLNIDPTLRKMPAGEVSDALSLIFGGMGVVSTSTWIYTEGRVVFKSTIINDWGTAEQFVSEVNRSRRCASHPQFPRIFGWMSRRTCADSLEGLTIMEKLDYHIGDYFLEIGQSRIPRPSWKQRIELLLKYANALNYLHNVEKCVHGDIHSGNLMIRMQNEASIDGFLID